jgi:large subunit ribosomal protein L15
MKKYGLISSSKKPVKILGNGEIQVKVQLEANAYSKSALEKIEAAGGSIKIV